MGIRLKIGAVVLAGGLLGAGPAIAHSATSPDGGSYVWNSTITYFNVKDPKCDGYGAYGYVNNTAHRLDNNNGCGATVSQGYGTITAVQACTNIPLASDPCSDWK
jgi:hypothetical protein